MLCTPNLQHVTRSGFARADQIIHLFVGGSELHGAKVGATDDLDLYGVFVGSPDELLGLDEETHFVWSTAFDERRNGPEDVDLTLYSLRRWAGLAAKGNATALHFLFADATATSTPLWQEVQRHASLFLSRYSAQQFLGFADNQLKRIVGDTGSGRHGRRPEYECRHGYDSKAAMHCLRLLGECAELMRDGRLTLPRPERDMLVGVRQGDLTLTEFIKEAGRLRDEAEQATQTSSLPEHVDRLAISRMLARVHLECWQLNADNATMTPPLTQEA